MQEFANTRHRVSASLGRLSGRMSRGIARRVGTNALTDALAHLQRRSFSSRWYWEQRYRKGGNSGAGSFGPVAEFKASTLNEFVRDKQIESVIELGCGDGNQLEHYTFPSYEGFDVSTSALQMCRERFRDCESMSFHSYPGDFCKLAPKADLCISIDVIFHLVEEKVFTTHLNDLFHAAKKYVIIFSTGFDRSYKSAHQVDRDFRGRVADMFPDFALDKTIVNPHKGADSQADFFVYRRMT